MRVADKAYSRAKPGPHRRCKRYLGVLVRCEKTALPDGPYCQECRIRFDEIQAERKEAMKK